MNHIRNAIWMQERGFQVAAFCVKETPIAQFAEEKNIPVIYIEPHKKYYDFKKANTLASILKKQQFTHLLIRATRDMSITASVKRKLGDNICTSYFMEMQLGVKKTNLLHSTRFRYIDIWSCPLNWLAEQVQTMTHFNNQLVVIPSGLDLSKFESIPSSQDARKQLELPSDKKLFGLIGRFDPQKGQLLLLEAVRKAKNKDFHVVLLGEPTINEGESYYQSMTDLIDQNDLHDRVHVRPFMEDVTIFFAAVDWFVMATKAETFGMVTIESLASGTPVLGSNAGGTPEILNGKKGGRLFETLDATDLANKIDEIVDNDIQPDIKTLIEMSRQYDHHKVCQLVEKHLNLIR